MAQGKYFVCDRNLVDCWSVGDIPCRLVLRGDVGRAQGTVSGEFLVGLGTGNGIVPGRGWVNGSGDARCVGRMTAEGQEIWIEGVRFVALELGIVVLEPLVHALTWNLMADHRMAPLHRKIALMMAEEITTLDRQFD